MLEIQPRNFTELYLCRLWKSHSQSCHSIMANSRFNRMQFSPRLSIVRCRNYHQMFMSLSNEYKSNSEHGTYFMYDLLIICTAEQRYQQFCDYISLKIRFSFLKHGLSVQLVLGKPLIHVNHFIRNLVIHFITTHTQIFSCSSKY